MSLFVLLGSSCVSIQLSNKWWWWTTMNHFPNTREHELKENSICVFSRLFTHKHPLIYWKKQWCRLEIHWLYLFSIFAYRKMYVTSLFCSLTTSSVYGDIAVHTNWLISVGGSPCSEVGDCSCSVTRHPRAQSLQPSNVAISSHVSYRNGPEP